MLLAIDVGNTNIALAVFDLGGAIGARSVSEEDGLIADWRVRTDANRTADEYWIIISNLLASAGLERVELCGACISSVVPGTLEPLKLFCRKYLKIDDPLILSAATAGIEVHYSPPHDVGADRLANAAAAYEYYGGPSIVVDFGTATTFDAVSADGQYLGGAIAPGIDISVEALIAHAAQLRRVELVAPPKAVGCTTAESVQSGILFGFAGQVDGMVERFREEIGEQAKVIATGGLAGLISPYSRTIEKVSPLLTLQGLRILYERARKTDE